MDVVSTHIEGIGGTVELLSRPGRGHHPADPDSAHAGHRTRAAGECRRRTLRDSADQPARADSAGGRGRTYAPSNTSTPLRYCAAVTPCCRWPISAMCSDSPERRQPDELNIVVVQVDGRRFGLIVDAINDTQEIVVKPLGQHLKSLNCYAGATIMGDGRIALILDVAGIGLRSGVTVPAPGRWRALPNLAKRPAKLPILFDRCCCCARAASSAWPCRSPRWRGWKTFQRRRWSSPPDGASCSTAIGYFRWFRWPGCWRARRLRRPRCCKPSSTATARRISAWWWTRSWTSWRKR